MNPTTPPLVSVIVVNWNGAAILERCLEAVARQTLQNYEIIVVDNASTDGSAEGLEQKYANLRLIQLEHNLDFAAANNLGARFATGKWVAILNNDAFPTETWLEYLLAASDSNPQFHFFASCLVQAQNPERLDSAGDILHISGLAWHRAYDQKYPLTNPSPVEVFGATAAAAFYPRSLFLEVGGFDECFVSHLEDVDLSFRLRLMGYRCLFVPQALVYHLGSASYGVATDRTVFQVQRNWVWLVAKNMPTSLLWRCLPAFCLAHLVFFIYYILHSQGMIYLRSKQEAIKGLREILRARSSLQVARTLSNSELLALLDRGFFSPYRLGKRTRPKTSDPI